VWEYAGEVLGAEVARHRLQLQMQVVTYSSGFLDFMSQMTCFFLGIFWGDLLYFVVTLHWMCTNLRRPVRFSSLLLLSEGIPRAPGPEIEPQTY